MVSRCSFPSPCVTVHGRGLAHFSGGKHVSLTLDHRCLSVSEAPIRSAEASASGSNRNARGRIHYGDRQEMNYHLLKNGDWLQGFRVPVPPFFSTTSRINSDCTAYRHRSNPSDMAKLASA